MDKKVRLTWKAGIADKDHATTKGKWVVFREKGKYCKPGTDSMERIATVRYDVSDGATATYEFEDTGSEKSSTMMPSTAIRCASRPMSGTKT